MVAATEKDGFLMVRVKVQPRSSRNQLVVDSDGGLKIKVHAPPVEGKANEECRRFLASVLGVSKSDVEILRGGTSRTKVLRVGRLNQQAFHELICREILK
jgi:hypothetical protein